MEAINLSLPDGSRNAIQVFAAVDTKAPVVVIFPALGVKAGYYRKFAEQLSAAGLQVVTTDHRGHGHSSLLPSRKVNFGYREQVEIEYPAILEAVQNRFPSNYIFIMGHSLGGQMGSMFVSRHSTTIRGLILNASCSVYYKGWKGLQGAGVLLAVLLARPIASVMGYFPGDKLKFGGKEARRLIGDWSYTGRTGKFRAKGSDFDYETAMQQSKVPVLAFSYAGDDSAPYASVKNLYGKFHPDAPVTHHHLVHPEAGKGRQYNHYSWVKQPEVSIGYIVEWIRRISFPESSAT